LFYSELKIYFLNGALIDPKTLDRKDQPSNFEAEQRDRFRNGTQLTAARKEKEPGRNVMTSFTTRLGFVSTLALATVLFAGAAQAADSNDRITPPNPNDVAILRGLLALQHPALRQAMPTVMPTSPSPAALTTEPSAPSSAPEATEGEACVSPDSSNGSCGTQSETSVFRASLGRAMAAAGFQSEHL
jgi:hypothetical protein